MKAKKFYPWIIVYLLWVVALLNYLDRQMLSTMQEAMKADIAELQKAEAFGALMAVFLWIYGIISPFAGMIADRVSRKWLVVGSLFVWSAVTLLMGYTTSFTQLYWLRAMMGISEALYIPSALSLIADWHSGKSRSLAVGVHTTGLYVGQAIGGFGAVVAASLSWNETFHIFGLIGIIYSIILILFLKEKRNETKAETIQENTAGLDSTTSKKEGLFAGLSIVLSTAAFWVVLFYFVAPSLPGWGIRNWLPTLFSSSLGIPMTEAGPMATITIAASSFVGVFIGGFMSDRWVQKNLKGRIYTSAIGLFLTIPSLLLIGLAHNLAAVLSAGILFGVGYGMFDTNNMPILCQFISARHRATAYGIMNMMGVFAGALVTTLMGRWSDDGNLGASFAWLALPLVIALLLQIIILKPKTDNKQ